MDRIGLNQSAESSGNRKFFPLVILLFFGSGCSALVYEVIWFQLLTFIIGSSSVSLGVLLGTYMGGMCLGSIALPRVISARRHPLLIYAALELGIGIIGVAILYAVPYIDKFYIGHVGYGMTGILMRGVVCAICLLPPTLLMGATLPAIARWIEATPKGASWLGFFYGGNIIGAVFGTLLAGFYLLRVHDMVVATYVAAAINLTVAVSGVVLSFLTHHTISEKVSEEIATLMPTGNRTIYLAIAMSGLSALGAEVVWTRIMSLILGGTVYTFSIILAMFLAGLGIGSSIGSFISRYARSPRLVFGLFQLLLAGAIAWTAYLIIGSLPYWPIDMWRAQNPWYNFQHDLLRCFWAFLPAACLWGASFPLALACVLRPSQEPGMVVGGVYAANTVGAIFGSLGFSMIFIPLFGTQQAQRILIGIAVASSLVVLLPVFWPVRVKMSPALKVKRPFSWLAGTVFIMVSIVLGVVLARGVSKIPWGMIAYGRFMPRMRHRLAPGIVKPQDVPTSGPPDAYCIYAAEAMDASVAVTLHTAGVQSFHSNGKVQASTSLRDMRPQRMLGHISSLINNNPQSVLVVGCGAGVTAGSFVLYPDVKRIVIVDIEKKVPQNVTPMFGSVNYNVVDDPRTELVFDDGRHYIHKTKEKFDIITSDPFDPWVKGCAALNTVEYYQICKDHLSPGGIMSVWMPFNESSLEAVKSQISTFFMVFPNGIIFGNGPSGSCYDAVLLGQNGTTQINLDEMQQRLNRPDHALVAQSLAEIDFDSVASLMATYAGRASDMEGWMNTSQINYDRNLRLQYLAGIGLNSYMDPEILSEILIYYRFPDDLFIGSDEAINRLKLLLRASGRK